VATRSRTRSMIHHFAPVHGLARPDHWGQLYSAVEPSVAPHEALGAVWLRACIRPGNRAPRQDAVLRTPAQAPSSSLASDHAHGIGTLRKRVGGFRDPCGNGTPGLSRPGHKPGPSSCERRYSHHQPGAWSPRRAKRSQPAIVSDPGDRDEGSTLLFWQSTDPLSRRSAMRSYHPSTSPGIAHRASSPGAKGSVA
jgi:hypothetical protein